MRNRIFSTDSPKAIKADKFGYLNGIHYLSPANVAGVGNVCGNESAGCAHLCLGHTSGQAGMVSDLDHDDNACRKSRREKTYRFMRDRIAYMRDVVRSIEGLERKTEKHDHKKLCVRMNGSSDIAWESIKCERDGVKHPNLMAAFPHIQFVDYTKKASRFDRALPANYHLTFSRSEINESDCVRLLERGVNVAVVFERKPLSWRGHVCIDGDEHDLRHLDAHAENGAAGYVVALTPKGRRAKADQSGFVVRSR